MKYILFVIAVLLLVLLFPFAIVAGGILLLGKGSRHGDYYYQMAYVIDVLGNVMLAPVLNRIAINPELSPHKFGNKYRTISYVLAVNRLYEALLPVGRALVWVINFFDRPIKMILTNQWYSRAYDHFGKALKNNQWEITNI